MDRGIANQETQVGVPVPLVEFAPLPGPCKETGLELTAEPVNENGGKGSIWSPESLRSDVSLGLRPVPSWGKGPRWGDISVGRCLFCKGAVDWREQ